MQWVPIHTAYLKIITIIYISLVLVFGAGLYLIGSVKLFRIDFKEKLRQRLRGNYKKKKGNDDDVL